VIADGGATVEIIKGVTMVDREPVEAPYVDPHNNVREYSRNMVKVHVPCNAFFVMGDNRDDNDDIDLGISAPQQCSGKGQQGVGTLGRGRKWPWFAHSIDHFDLVGDGISQHVKPLATPEGVTPVLRLFPLRVGTNEQILRPCFVATIRRWSDNVRLTAVGKFCLVAYPAPGAFDSQHP
jgi:hypothetical protein